jgi:hypothetical protein
MNAVPTPLAARRAALLRQRLMLDWRRQGVSLREMSRRLRLAPETVRKSLASVNVVLPGESQFEQPEPNDPPPGFDPANLRRCRSCGALVYLWPCLACELEAETVTSSSQGATCHVHS